jgi:pyruvate ferredoxin oxidoreductase alpha subunit
MAQRDSGWIQMFAENAQEAYDSTIQAFRIAENSDVLLPVMVGLDGFTLSHTLENVEALSDEVVKDFVGVRKLPNILTHEGKSVPFKLDPANPMTMGPIALQNYYFEFKRQQEEAMKNALAVIQQVNREFAEISGRSYGDGLIDAYRLEDAEVAAVCLGSTSGTMKTIVDALRQEGVKAGLLRLRTFRPLPVEAIRSALENVKAVAVMDKCMSFGGNGGPVFHEVRHVLYEAANRPFIVNYIYGLGGRDTSPAELRSIYENLQRMLQSNRVEMPIQYLGLRE